MTNQILQSDVTYRRMSEHDLAAAHELSLGVRWPHRHQDWQFVHRLGSGYVAEDGDGKVIATIMCWSHGTRFASIGMVIVSPDWQGKGIGRKLMEKVMTELGQRSIMLNATQSGHHLYERLGFAPIGTIHQHQGTVSKWRPMALPPGEQIRPFDSREGNELAALCARANGMPRGTVLAALLEVAECVVIEHDDEVIGCAMLRRFGRGYAIGPVVAPDLERAAALVSHWGGSHAGSFVRIDVPADLGLSPWLNELGLVQVDSVVCMVKGEAPRRDEKMRLFAIVNQALG